MALLYHVFSDELPNPKHTEFRYDLELLKAKIVATNLKNYYVLAEDTGSFVVAELKGSPSRMLRDHMERTQDKLKATKLDLQGLLGGTVRPEKIVGRMPRSNAQFSVARSYLENSIDNLSNLLNCLIGIAGKDAIDNDVCLRCPILGLDVSRDVDGKLNYVPNEVTGCYIVDPLRLTNRELIREVRRQGLLHNREKGTVGVRNDGSNLIIFAVKGNTPIFAVKYAEIYNRGQVDDEEQTKIAAD